MKVTFKQSKYWWQPKDLDWFIENADFAFTNNGYKGNRVRIVTKQKLRGYNCFEFDNDGCGIIITSESEYTKFWEESNSIVEKTNDVLPILINFLTKWGAGEYINPKFKLSSIFNIFTGKYKLINIEE